MDRKRALTLRELRIIALGIVNRMPHSTHRIALIYDARLTYDLKVMTGVAAYLQEGHHYSVFIEENALKDQRLPDLRTW